jgi:hypothetical protein
MGKRFSHNATVASASRRLGAMKKYVTGRKVTIPLAGKLLTPAQVATIFQESLDTQAAVAQRLAAYKGAIAERDAAEKRRLAADEAMKGWVLQLFGDGSTEAVEFGYAARKKPEMSAEDRAKAVELRRATREARGTMGKKQKLKIRGVVPLIAASETASSPATLTPAPHVQPTTTAATNGSERASSPPTR